MNTEKNKSTGLDARTKQSTIRLGFWTAGWVATLAIATFGAVFLWDMTPIPTLIAVGVNLIAGVGMIWANARHIKGLDELMQQIQLQAMGVSLGVTIVAGLGFNVLDMIDLIDFNIGFLVILSTAVYMIALFLGHRRYK